MNLSILKKTIPAVLLASVCASALSAGAMTASAAETDNTDTMPTGLLEMTADEEAAMKEFFGETKPAAKSRGMVNTVALPSEVDLSRQPNFPAIGSQGGVGSCGAWSTTYYQFTYEAYKGSSVDLKDPDNAGLIYSPLFTYNFANGGEAGGTYQSHYYEILERQGCMKQADYPYPESASASTLNLQWPTDEEKLKEALELRITDRGYVNVPSSTGEGIQQAKAMLYGTNGTDGHVFTIGTYYYSWKTKNWLNPDTQELEEVAWGCYGRSQYNPETKQYEVVYDGAHGMTVVGYNDNVWVDINGNGIDEAEEYGAFKIANSHGTWNNNEGYVWVSYDAFNDVSQVPNAPAYDYRDRIFWGGNLYWYSVGKKDNYLIGETTIDTTKRDTVSVWTARSTAEYPDSFSYKKMVCNTIYNNHDFAFNGKVFFAYDDVIEPLDEYMTGYNLGVDVDGTMTSGSFRITDNKGNLVMDLGAITTEPKVAPLKLKMWDLNYDFARNSADDAIHDAGNLSSLQTYLDKDYQYSNNNDELIPNGKITTEYIVDGDSVTVKVYNAGEADLRNWALRVDNFGGTPHDFWNATLDGDVIYCVDFNSVIPVGGYVTFGYKLSDMTGAVPTFTLCSAVIDVTDLVDVLFECVGDYGNSAQYKITLINNDSEDIIGWSISFTAEGFVINNVWGAGNGFELNDGVYTINCANYNGCNVIPADGQVEIFFMATKDGDGAISDIHVYAITEIESVND